MSTACVHLQRDPTTDLIDIRIDEENLRVSIANTGRGIRIERHEKENAWVPDLVMGSLYTGSNFDDSTERTVGGRHGFGAKLTNIFSREFEIETMDVSAGLHYSQRWSNNMSTRSEPEIQHVSDMNISQLEIAPHLVGFPRDFTRVSFVPDLERFGVSDFSEDMLALFRRRAVEAALCALPAKVRLNGELIEVEGLQDFMQLHLADPPPASELNAFLPVSSKQAGLRWEVGACLSPGVGFQHVSFVNGVSTPRGGTHVDHVAGAILEKLTPQVPKNCSY